MHGYILMTLLEAVVLFDEMQVVSPDDQRALHLGRDGHPLYDLAADADGSCEGALLVNVLPFLRLLWSLEAEPHVLPVPLQRSTALFSKSFLCTDEDGILFLEGFLGLVHGSVCVAKSQGLEPRTHKHQSKHASVFGNHMHVHALGEHDSWWCVPMCTCAPSYLCTFVFMRLCASKCLRVQPLSEQVKKMRREP